MFKHRGKIASVGPGDVFMIATLVLGQTLIIFILIVVEGVQAGLGDLHTYQDFIARIVLTLNILHLKESVEHALQGLDLVDGLEASHILVLLSRIRNA